MDDNIKSISPHRSHKFRYFFIFAAIILIILLLRVSINTFQSKKQKTTPPLSVGVASIKTANVPVYFSALGTVSPDVTITVKPQVSGILTHVYFNDGQMVKAGDVLAEIDPRPFEAQLLQSQGQLMRDQALLSNAKQDVKRYGNLYKKKYVSEQQLNTQQSLVKQYEGAIKIDQGQIKAAETNLSFSKIKSPVSGRIGIGIVDQGNLVQPSDSTGIAVITTLDPITVIFSLPEDDVPIVEKAFNSDKKLRVDAYNRSQDKLLATGTLTAIDNQVNVTTGTVKLKALFENKTHLLFPNQFVNINLQVSTLQNALIIPTSAVLRGTEGSYVYRYNPADHTVTHLPVKTGVSQGENTVITSGLTKNDRVVTIGADKLFEGAKVVATGNME